MSTFRSLNGLQNTIDVNVSFDTDDFFRLPGRIGGQTAVGGIVSGDNLIFQSNIFNDGVILLQDTMELNQSLVFNQGFGLTLSATPQTVTPGTVAFPDFSGAPAGEFLFSALAQTVTNKTIDAGLNTLSNIGDSEIKATAGIDVSKLADGSVSNTEFQFLDGVLSTVVGVSDNVTLTNKSIDADVNSLSNITDGNIKSLAGISVTKIADGSVSNDEFQRLNGISSAAVGENDTNAMTNKSMTDATNNVTARSLFSSSGTHAVSVYASPNPTSGDVLTATSATAATWQAPTVDASGWTDDGSIVRLTTATDKVGMGIATSIGGARLTIVDDIYMTYQQGSQAVITLDAVPNSNAYTAYRFSGGDLWRAGLQGNDSFTFDSGTLSDHLVLTNSAAGVSTFRGSGTKVILDSTGDASFVLDRNAVTDTATLDFQVSGSDDWKIQATNDTGISVLQVGNSSFPDLLKVIPTGVVTINAPVPLLAVVADTSDSKMQLSKVTATDDALLQYMVGTSTQWSVGTKGNNDYIISSDLLSNQMTLYHATTGGAEFTGPLNIEGTVGSVPLSVYSGSGQTVPGTLLGQSAVFVNNDTSGDDCAVSILSRSNGNAILSFGDETDIDTGKIDYNHTAGDMEFHVEGSKRMTLNPFGNNSTLQVNAQTGTGLGSLRFDNGSNNGRWDFSHSTQRMTGVASGGFEYFVAGTGKAELYRPYSDLSLTSGGVGRRWNGTFTRLCTGSSSTQVAIDGNGCLTSFSSDNRLKKNMAPYALDWSTFMAVEPVSYEWKTTAELEAEASNPARDVVLAEGLWDAAPSETQYGFDAQALEGQYPEAVFENNGVKALTKNMDHVYVAAIQDLKTALDDALARIAVLEAS